MLRWYGEGKLKTHISKSCPLEKTSDGLGTMIRREVAGKVVVTVGG